MPTVPVYKRQAQTQNQPGVRVTTDVPREAFGGGSSLQRTMDAAQGIIGTVQKIAVEERDQADKLRIIDAHTRLTEKRNDLFWNPEKGAMNRKGQDAFSVLDDYGKEFDTYADSIEGELNDRQRTAFRAIRFQQRKELEHALNRHMAHQAKVYESQTFESSLGVAHQDGVVNAAIPGKVQASITEQRQLIEAFGRSNGWDDKTIQYEGLKRASKTHTSVINQLLDNEQYQKAREHFDKHREEIIDDRSSLQRHLEAGELEGRAKWLSGKIIKESPNAEAATTAVSEIQDPELQAKVARLVPAGLRLKSRKDTEAADTNFLSAVGSFRAGKVPQSQLNSLLPADRKLIEDLQTGEPRHDEALYTRLSGLSSTKLANYSKADMLRFQLQLSPEAAGNLEKQWQVAKKAVTEPTAKNKAEASSMASDKDMTLAALKDTNLIGNADTWESLSKKEDGRKMLLAVDSALMAKNNEYLAQHNKPMPDAEKRKFLGELMTKKVYVEKAWARDPYKPEFMLTDEEREKAYFPYDQIPSDAREKIETKLRQVNPRVSKEEVGRAYLRWLSQAGKK